MSLRTVLALVLALGSTTLANLAYLREHDAAVSLAPLSVRRPIHSVRLLLRNRSWLIGFAMETGGFALYAAALALASLALVQTIGAGGIVSAATVPAMRRKQIIMRVDRFKPMLRAAVIFRLHD